MFTSNLATEMEHLKALRYRQLAARLEGESVEVDELEAAVDRLLMELEDARRQTASLSDDLVVRPLLPPVAGEPQMACL